MTSVLDELKKYRALKQVSTNTACSAVSIIANFASIPMFLNILGQKDYGIWVALFSMITWVSIADLGIGSGLRNILGVALARQENNTIQKSIFTAYVSITSICILLFIVNYLITLALDIGEFFPDYEQIKINEIYTYTVISFLLILQGKLVHSIAAAYHRSEFASIVNALQTVGICVLLFTINYFEMPAEILSFVKLFCYLCVLIYTLPCIIIVIRIVGRKNFTFRLFHWFTLKKLLNFGWRFLILQISAIVLYSTDAFLLQYYFSPEVTAEYGTYMKFFGIIVLLTTILGSPLWSVTVSESENTGKTVLNLLKSNLLYYYIFLLLCCFLLLIIQKPIFQIWVPTLNTTDNTMVVLIAVYSFMQCILFTTGNIINGSGALFLQSILAPTAAILNLLLVIIGVNAYGFGVNWIIASTIIVNIPSLVICWIHANKVLNADLSGIWAR